MWLFTWAVLALSVLVEVVECSTKCYRNKELGENSENVYYCYDDTMPECCEVDSTFTCCETSTRKNVREQLQLWGTVAGFTLILVFLFLCCKNDYSICNDDRPLAARFGLRKSVELRTNSVSPTHDVYSCRQKSDNHANSRYYERLPPLPPPTPRPEQAYGKRGFPARDDFCNKGGYRSFDDDTSDKGGKANDAFENDEDLCYK